MATKTIREKLQEVKQQVQEARQGIDDYEYALEESIRDDTLEFPNIGGHVFLRLVTALNLLDEIEKEI